MKELVSLKINSAQDRELVVKAMANAGYLVKIVKTPKDVMGFLAPSFCDYHVKVYEDEGDKS